MFKYLCSTVLVIASAWTIGLTPSQAQSKQTLAAQSFDGELLRDPTRPFAALSSSQVSSGIEINSDRSLSGGGLARSNYNVTFIRDGDTSPMAVINDQRVTIGDLIDGATVVAISSAGVTLSVNGLEQVINTFGPTVKKVSGTEF